MSYQGRGFRRPSRGRYRVSWPPFTHRSPSGCSLPASCSPMPRWSPIFALRSSGRWDRQCSAARQGALAGRGARPRRPRSRPRRRRFDWHSRGRCEFRGRDLHGLRERSRRRDDGTSEHEGMHRGTRRRIDRATANQARTGSPSGDSCRPAPKAIRKPRSRLPRPKTGSTAATSSALKAATSDIGTSDIPLSRDPVSVAFFRALRPLSIPLRLEGMRRVPLLTKVFTNTGGIVAVQVAETAGFRYCGAIGIQRSLNRGRLAR